MYSTYKVCTNNKTSKLYLTLTYAPLFNQFVTKFLFCSCCSRFILVTTVLIRHLILPCSQRWSIMTLKTDPTKYNRLLGHQND